MLIIQNSGRLKIESVRPTIQTEELVTLIYYSVVVHYQSSTGFSGSGTGRIGERPVDRAVGMGWDMTLVSLSAHQGGVGETDTGVLTRLRTRTGDA